MRGRPVLRTISWKPWDRSLLRGLLLALFFLLGALAGHLYAGACVKADPSALSRYLTDYCAVYSEGGQAASFGGCILLYFGYVVLAFLLGFASVGVVLIPALSGTFGFLTMYTISCCARAFGRAGVPVAMGALLIRLLFSMPCFFALAGEAWPLATELALLSLGRGKRSAPVLYGSRYFLLFLLCVVILAVGVLCERFLTPLLFRLALEGVL